MAIEWTKAKTIKSINAVKEYIKEANITYIKFRYILNVNIVG